MPTQTPEKRKLFTSTLETNVKGVLVGVLRAFAKQHNLARSLRFALTVPSSTAQAEPVLNSIQEVSSSNQTALLRKTPNRTGQGRLLAAGFVMLVAMVTGFGLAHPGKSAAATNGTVNFQARLSSAAGAIAADGNYNVEFKLYSASTGGTALWTEDYLNTNSQGITVKNGYLSANLGAITAFPSTINWDQDLYLGMTVRGTGSCSFGSCTPNDAEMTPRLKLTSTPYAFAAGKISQYNGTSGYTSTLDLQAPTGGDQNFVVQDQGTAGTYDILTAPSGSDGYVKLQGPSPSTQSGNLAIDGSATVNSLQAGAINGTGGHLYIGNDSSLSNDIHIGDDNSSHTIKIGTGGGSQLITIGSTNSDSSLMLQSGNGGTVINSGSAGLAFQINGGAVGSVDSAGRWTINPTSDTTSAFVIQSSDAHAIFGVDTSSFSANVYGNFNILNGDTTSANIYSSGPLTLDSSSSTSYISPHGAHIATKINIPNYNPGAYGQILALGLPDAGCNGDGSTGDCTQRVITVLDARTHAHQPSISVLSPDENQVLGLSWDGSTSVGYLKNSASAIVLQANGLNIFKASNSSGNAVVELGTNGSILLQSADTASASTLSLGTSTATGVSIGKSGATTTINGALTSTQLLTATAGITIGSGAGSGTVFTNNGATLNSTLALADMPSGGSIGSAASTVDSYTAVSISQTTTDGQTITIPTPTASTNYGRLLYVSNIGTKNFILLGLTINPGATATLIWANTNGGASWTFAGADGSSIQNQTSNTQSAGFKISGTGYAAGFDAATAGALNIGSSNATSLNIGSGNVTSTLIKATSVGIQSTSDNASAFTIANSAGATVFSADTTNTASGTNLAVNSGAEAGTTTPTSWAAHGSATLTRDTGIVASGTASAKAATTGATQGVRNNVGTAVAASNPYTVSFSIRTATAALTNANLGVVFSPDGTTSNNASCVAGSSTTAIGSTAFTKFSCTMTTTSTTTTASAYLAIYQTDATTRSIYVDNLSITLQNSSGIQNTGIIRIGGANSQGLTLLTLDSYAGNPFTGTNKALAGSMYFDTTAGSFQCYDGSRWGACGATPNTNVTLAAEYQGAVLHGSGSGTLTADFCSDDLNINDGSSSQPTICGTGETNNFYRWTSASGSAQAYSIYVTYKLPSNFKNFVASSTSMLGKTDLASNTVQYSVYKNVGGTMTQCGTAVSVSSGVQTTWQTGTASGSADPSSCSFAAGNSLVFKIDASSLNGGNVYIGNINFQYVNQ